MKMQDLRFYFRIRLWYYDITLFNGILLTRVWKYQEWTEMHSTCFHPLYITISRSVNKATQIGDRVHAAFTRDLLSILVLVYMKWNRFTTTGEQIILTVEMLGSK